MRGSCCLALSKLPFECILPSYSTPASPLTISDLEPSCSCLLPCPCARVISVVSRAFRLTSTIVRSDEKADLLLHASITHAYSRPTQSDAVTKTVSSIQNFVQWRSLQKYVIPHRRRYTVPLRGGPNGAPRSLRGYRSTCNAAVCNFLYTLQIQNVLLGNEPHRNRRYHRCGPREGAASVPLILYCGG